MQFEDTVQNMLATIWPVSASPQSVLELEFRFGSMPKAQIQRARHQYLAMVQDAVVSRVDHRVAKFDDDLRGLQILDKCGQAGAGANAIRFERKVELGRNRWPLYGGALNLDCVLSQEHPVVPPGDHARPRAVYNRHRACVAVPHGAWRVDFTVRDDHQGAGNVEIELVGGRDVNGNHGARLQAGVMDELRQILRRLVVILSPAAAGDIGQVSTITGLQLGVARRMGKPHLQSAQRTAYDIMRHHMPVSLTADHQRLLQLATSGPCPTALVTPKVDGVRCVLYVAPDQDPTTPVAQLFFRSSRTECLPLKSAMGWKHADDRMAQPWILDCEVVPDRRLVFVMDAFATPTTAACVMQHMGLAQRQDVLRRDWAELAPDTDGLLDVRLKPWVQVTAQSLAGCTKLVGDNVPCDGLVFGFRGRTRVFLKWKPVPTVDKVVHRVDYGAGTCVLDGGEVAALGDLASSVALKACVSPGGHVHAGVVAEFAAQVGTGSLVGQRLRRDKKTGNAPQTERDVRASAALGLVDVGMLAEWCTQ